MSPQRPLTILQVLPALKSGGVERGVLEIASAIVRAGHRSLVVSAGGRMVDELGASGTEHFARTIGAKSPLTLRHIPWLRRFLIEQQVDVIDVHSRLPGWMTWLAWKSLPSSRRPALISTVHGLYSPGRYSSIMCRGQHVIAVSESVNHYVKAHYPFVPNARLHVIHRGIDPAEFPRGFYPSSAWREEFFQLHPNAVGKPILMLPGRLTRLKGHADFLQLIARLQEANSVCHGLIVGDADSRKAAYVTELKDQISRLNLSRHVTFLGHRTDLQELYAISSVVLSLSSRPEAFGRTVAEALSIGTMVVGYSHGGVEELLAALFPAGRVPVGDLNFLTATVLSLLKHGQTPELFSNIYTRQMMQLQTVQLYERSCERPVGLGIQRD